MYSRLYQKTMHPITRSLVNCSSTADMYIPSAFHFLVQNTDYISHKTIHLEDEVAMGGVAQAQVILVQVPPELGQVLILSADVGGQDQRPQLSFHV